MWHISANRDEAVFTEPFRFDITRTPNNHVAFGGGGPHHCLGAYLARMQLRLMTRGDCGSHSRHATGGEARASPVERSSGREAHAGGVHTGPPSECHVRLPDTLAHAKPRSTVLSPP